MSATITLKEDSYLCDFADGAEIAARDIERLERYLTELGKLALNPLRPHERVADRHEDMEFCRAVVLRLIKRVQTHVEGMDGLNHTRAMVEGLKINER